MDEDDAVHGLRPDPGARGLGRLFAAAGSEKGRDEKNEPERATRGHGGLL
jgi:hypothetical protein